ncbi:hypothetical protein C8R46DRAFT_1096294 [Mycena filopes]|nr:hypothetical protein C8R46DRAFT_1096294 [Mycena filopes]
MSTLANPSDAATLSASLFESLLLKLLAVLELTARPEGTVTPQAKQALLHATNDFKATLARAKTLATHLPGGELRTDEQTEVLGMLTELRDRKRAQLADFSARALASGVNPGAHRPGMEVDSVASTPFHE